MYRSLKDLREDIEEGKFSIKEKKTKEITVIDI
jgi:hypothetical protein